MLIIPRDFGVIEFGIGAGNGFAEAGRFDSVEQWLLRMLQCQGRWLVPVLLPQLPPLPIRANAALSYIGR